MATVAGHGMWTQTGSLVRWPQPQDIQPFRMTKSRYDVSIQTNNPSSGGPALLTRGKKPEAAIDEAKGFAERMGYNWMDNLHEELPFDFFIFKPASFRAVKVRLTRYQIDPEVMYQKLFPERDPGLAGTPVPPVHPPRALAPHPAPAGLAPAGHL